MPRKENGGSRISVCVLDAHPLAGRYLLNLLDSDCDLSVTSWRDCQQKAPAPHAFVVDMALLREPLSRLLHTLRSNFPASKFIVLGENASEAELVKLLFLGVHGFLSYEQVEDSLAEAVRAASAGNFWVPRRVLQQYINVSSRLGEKSYKWGAGITKRQREILELLLRRLSNKEIANALGIRESTVKFHLTQIFAKFQVTDRASLQESIAQQQMLGRFVAPETSRV